MTSTGDALHKFLIWHWGAKSRDQPQVWFTYEALVGLGVPMDNLLDDLADLVVATFQRCVDQMCTIPISTKMARIPLL